MSALTSLQVLQACEQCRAQWRALRHAHGLPRHSRRPAPTNPQSPTERLMEDTGCDAFQALLELSQAQDAGLILMPEDGVSEPWITAKGRAALDCDISRVLDA